MQRLNLKNRAMMIIMMLVLLSAGLATRHLSAVESIAAATASSDVKSLTTGDIAIPDTEDWYAIMLDLRWPALQVAHSLSLLILVGGAVMIFFLLSPAVTRNFERAELGQYWLAVLSRHIFWTLGSGLILLTSTLIEFYWSGGMIAPSLGGMVSTGMAILMGIVFLLMVVIPFGKLRRALQASNWLVAHRCLTVCRLMIFVFMILGLAMAGVSSLTVDPISFE
ncbi:MAG: hypothetical protein QM523_09935 [Candidatus Pacebacteria bacterium]|nr:hypothetical protein [Candidatus Paceibacterota bacterium]